jgi:hypothetical protein
VGSPDRATSTGGRGLRRHRRWRTWPDRTRYQIHSRHTVCDGFGDISRRVDEALELANGHLVPPEPKRSRDAHAVNRLLVAKFVAANRVVLREGSAQGLHRFVAVHLEFTGAHAHQPDSSGVDHLLGTVWGRLRVPGSLSIRAGAVSSRAWWRWKRDSAPTASPRPGAPARRPACRTVPANRQGTAGVGNRDCDAVAAHDAPRHVGGRQRPGAALRSIQSPIQPAIWRLLRSCISMCVLPMMPRSGSAWTCTRAPASFAACAKARHPLSFELQ